MDELDERRFVVEWWRDRETLATAKHIAGARAVDPDLFHLGVGEVLGERPEWRHRGEDSPPQPLARGVVEMRFLGDQAPDHLVDPPLVFDAQPCPVLPGKLKRQLRLDATLQRLLQAPGGDAHSR